MIDGHTQFDTASTSADYTDGFDVGRFRAVQKPLPAVQKLTNGFYRYDVVCGTRHGVK